MTWKDWIPLLMAATTVASLAVTIYFGRQQTRHSRAVLSVQLAQEFRRDFDSGDMRKSRGGLAAALVKGAEPDYDRVAGLFETMGHYVRQRALDKEAVYNDFSDYVIYYWPALKDHIHRDRSEPHGGPDYYVNFEWLHGEMLSAYANRHRQTVAQVVPSPDSVREFLSDESQLAEETKPAKRPRPHL